MYLGIDLGTSSVKLVLCNEEGIVQHTISKSYDMQMPQTNWAQQNPDDWWNMTKKALREIFAYPVCSPIKGISFSGQMHGLVILDKNDTVIRPAILWCDQRTQAECDMLNNEVGLEKLLCYTGNQALTGFTAPKLLWIKKNEPDNFNRIHKIMLPKDYIQYKLTGIFASDMSDASGTLMFDVAHRCWSKAMLKILGIQESLLPRLYESYEPVGKLTHDLMEEFHICEDVIIAAGAGDQAAGAIGVGVVENGRLSVALGTSGVVFLPCKTYSADPLARLHSFADANGGYNQMGVILSAAGALKWWLETIQNDNDYQKALEIGAKNATAEGLYFLPYLIGERTPINDSDAKGCFIGLNLSHTKGDMSRALLKGVAFALRESYEIIREMKQPIHEIRISGGGSQSDTWKQIIADIFQLPVTIIDTEQGPAYGAAILAKAAVTNTSVHSICNAWIKQSGVFYPNSEWKEQYEKEFLIYQSMYPLLKPLFKKINN